MKPIQNEIAEEVLEARHPSGIRVRIARKRGFSKTCAVLATRFGSVDRILPRGRHAEAGEELPDGLAHFLEHQMFESEGGDVAERFAALGASSNAYTSFTDTCYVFETSSRVEECLALLLELIRSPRFTPESVKKEVAVIAQEIRMIEDDPGSRLFQNLLRILYRSHPVRIPIAGTESSIASITPDLLGRCHAAYYRPPNLSLALAGDVDPERVVRLLDEAFREGADRGASGATLPAPERDDGPPAASEIRATMDVARPKWLLGFKDVSVPAGGIELLERELLSGMVLDAAFSVSSAAHERWLHDGIVDDSFGFDSNAEPGFGFSVFAADLDAVPSENDAPPVERAVMEEIARIRRAGIRDDDFDRVRNKQLGRFVAFFDSLDALASSLAQSAFHELTPFHWIARTQQITKADVERRAREMFDSRCCARSLVLPQASAPGSS